ncbi:MAG: hypothetical protein NDI93_00520 [Pseudomonas sp.]|nr:hypothetical protein [Pseudomonas sp.]
MAEVQHVVVGAGAPDSAPPSIGAHYINTTNGDQYLSNGISSVDDWVFHSAVGPKGEDGVGIASAAVDEQGHLILTMTDASTVDAGPLPSLGGGEGSLSAGTLAQDPPRVVAVGPMVYQPDAAAFDVLVPNEAIAGDLLALFVSSAGTLTVPAGWTLAAERADASGQRCAVFTRNAQAGDAGSFVAVTPTDSSNGMVLVLRGSSQLAVISHQALNVDGTATWRMAMASVTATADGQMALAATVHDFWFCDGYLGYAEGDWTDNSQIASTEDMSNDDRFLHVASLLLGTGEASEGYVVDTYAMQREETTLSYSAITLLIGYAA